MIAPQLARTAVLSSLAVLGACGDDVAGATVQGGSGGGTDVSMTSSSTTGGTMGTMGSTTRAETTGTTADPTGSDTPDPDCEVDGTCNQIDLLIVIDNSSTMGEEQLNVAANLGPLVERLQDLEDANGNRLEPNVNIMVTTTDMGSCASSQDSEPRRGAPVFEGCNARIADFTGLGDDPLVVEEGCTQHCPQDIGPGQHFIHFDAQGTNVPGDDVAAALSCIGPQGIRGCEYEAPLEAMLRALDPSACWNDPQQARCEQDPQWASATEGFLREDATLVVMIIADEADCSVPPSSFSHFTDDDTHWAVNPATMLPEPSSAVCWNAGAPCEDEDDDGVYESCSSNDAAGVLHPVERYTSYLRQLREEQGKKVVMLGVLGVPPVTAHNADPPFEPIEGGVSELVYRDWIDGVYGGVDPGDLLPEHVANGETVQSKRFQFGAIGPGCTRADDDGGYTGQALPPTRIREVCESLDYTDEEGSDQIRCCIESVCGTDFSAAINCLIWPMQDFGPSG